MSHRHAVGHLDGNVDAPARLRRVREAVVDGDERGVFGHQPIVEGELGDGLLVLRFLAEGAGGVAHALELGDAVAGPQGGHGGAVAFRSRQVDVEGAPPRSAAGHSSEGKPGSAGRGVAAVDNDGLRAEDVGQVGGSDAHDGAAFELRADVDEQRRLQAFGKPLLGGLRALGEGNDLGCAATFEAHRVDQGAVDAVTNAEGEEARVAAETADVLEDHP
ncbi:hypothetical protein EON82_08715, partial [bacterium]